MTLVRMTAVFDRERIDGTLGDLASDLERWLNVRVGMSGVAVTWTRDFEPGTVPSENCLACAEGSGRHAIDCTRERDVKNIANVLAQAHVMHLDTTEAIAALERLAGLTL